MSAQIKHSWAAQVPFSYTYTDGGHSSPRLAIPAQDTYLMWDPLRYSICQTMFSSVKSPNSPYKSSITSHIQIAPLGVSAPKVQLKRRISLFMVYSIRWPPHRRVGLTCATCSLDQCQILTSSSRGSEQFHYSSSPAMRKRKNVLLLFYERWEM